MLYKNKKTGTIIDTHGEISGGDWEPVKTGKSKKTEKSDNIDIKDDESKETEKSGKTDVKAGN